MRTHQKIVVGTILIVAGGWFAGCNYPHDEEPNVVLEVATMRIPPVAANVNGLICTFTITEATATFNNKPKNTLAAASPANDIVMHDVVADFAWDDGAPAPTTQTFAIAGTVPGGGSIGLNFMAVNDPVLTSAPNRDGHSARVNMVFHGTTVAGEAVSTIAGTTLFVNSCTTPLGACCTGPTNTSCALTTQLACGGTYKGDNTTCSAPGCP